MKLIQVQQLATLSFMAMILSACTSTGLDSSRLTNIISKPKQSITQEQETPAVAVPMPKVSISNVKYIKTIHIATTTDNKYSSLSA